MDRRTITIDPADTKLRRVGHVARRRMRIDGDALRNGTHTDGTLSVEIRGPGSPVAGVPDSFTWHADRPIALVITRSGVDGEDVQFQVGPARSGVVGLASPGDGSGIRSIAFCYDAVADDTAIPMPAAEVAAALGFGSETAPSLVTEPGAPVLPRPAATRPFLPTGRERRSILGLLFDGGRLRSKGGSLA